MRISGVLLMMCVAVCLQGDVSNSTTTKKSTEEKTSDSDTVLGQVLDELRFLRDADEKKTDEINNLKEMNEQFLNEINTLKDEDQKNKEENKKNKDEIHSLNEKYMAEIITLKDEDQKNKEENKKSKDEIHSLKNADEKKTDEINNIKEINEQFQNEINTLKGETTNSQAVAASAAFTAVMDVGYLHPDPGDVLPFNTVWLNLGQHYNDQTSVFTCAESGLYLFSVTLYSGVIRSGTDYYQMSGALMLDGFVVAEVYSWTGDPDHSQAHQSAVTAVVECPKGGSVWVECKYDDSRIYGTDTLLGSVFTGFAITYNSHP